MTMICIYNQSFKNNSNLLKFVIFIINIYVKSLKLKIKKT